MDRKENKNNKSTLKSFEQILKGKKKEFKDNQKKNKKFSKKKYKESILKERVHLNSKSQNFIRNKIGGKLGKTKIKGKRK